MVTTLWRRSWDAWDRFWFAPESTSTLALLRIAFGALMVAWTLSLFPDLTALYSEVGVVPEQPRWQTPITLLAWWDSPIGVAVLWAVMLSASVCLALGYQTRLAAIVVFVALLSFERRNPDALNGGDVLLRLVAFYFILAPAGAALSIDRWRAGGTPWDFPRRAPWALRLIQLQLSFMYLASVFWKLQGEEWVDGTAFGYIARLTDLQRLVVPDFLSDQLILVNLATYGTLAVEFALAVLVWNRRARPWVLVAGVALHLGIEITMTLGFFSMVVFVTYLAFVPPDTAERWVGVARRRLTKGALRQEPVAEPVNAAVREDGARPTPAG